MGKITINELEIDVIRAWKDEEYRNSLSEEQRSQLPENPAGVIELSDEEMGTVAGGFDVWVAGPSYNTIDPWLTNCPRGSCFFGFA